jgi:hypothetical protein
VTQGKIKLASYCEHCISQHKAGSFWAVMSDCGVFKKNSTPVDLVPFSNTVYQLILAV